MWVTEGDYNMSSGIPTEKPRSLRMGDCVVRDKMGVGWGFITLQRNFFTGHLKSHCLLKRSAALHDDRDHQWTLCCARACWAPCAEKAQGLPNKAE